MAFRTKCPSCGRRQSVPDEDAGHSVWCSACGNRFDAYLYLGSDIDPQSSDSTIPDISFFPPPVPPVPPPTPLSYENPDAELVVEPLAEQPIGLEPAAPAVGHKPLVAPPPIVPARISPSLIPIGIAVVLCASVLMAVGVFFLGAWVGEHRHNAVANAAHAAPVTVSFTPPPRQIQSQPTTAAAPATVAQSRVAQPHEPRPIQSETPVPVPVVVKETEPPIPVAPEKFQPVKFQPVHPAGNGALGPDEQIGQSIDRGVNYLLSQFANGQLKSLNERNGMSEGMDALAVYALLQAGEATHDSRLGPNSAEVASMLDALKKLSMDRADSTYARSLRCAALSVYHRADDKQALRADCAWLIADSNNGAYTYEPQPKAAREGNSRGSAVNNDWDNSNSQYGALGVWAALEAGVEVPNNFWMAVQKHWLSCQLPDGEWAYRGYGEMGRLSMTVAGITTLLVTEDQLDARAVVSTLGHAPFTPALQRGLNWLESGNNSVRLPANWRTYNLFGLERAALASGFKYFGTHDWYRELAKEQIALQEPNGSWQGSNPIVDTSYTLLFLSRGRHPIFMNKLRFDGFWANRPRDIANLSHYASTVLERPVNWQVVSLKSEWSDWMDSPVLYIASHEALKFSDDDVAKLRSFAENGGLIFTHADGDTPAFNKSIAELSKRLFPEYPLTDLPTTHPIFSTLYKIKLQPKLQGISNGSRLLLVHSPTDINKPWQLRDWTEHPADFQMGINIFIYAAGKANLRNKLKTPLVPEPEVTPILTTQIAQLKYPGDWNPEPVAWPRFARLFLGDTSVKLNVVDTDPLMLDVSKMPVAQLSGTVAVRYDTAQLQALQRYVDNGGILLIDACGGSQAFLKSMLIDCLPHAFPKTLFHDMESDQNVLAGNGAGMTPVNLKLRPYRSETDGTTTQPLQMMTEGKGMVILSSVDITTGLLGTNTWPINGYTPETCYDLVRNIVLYALEK